MELFIIQGVKVELAQTSSSANPDQEKDNTYNRTVLHAFHSWYRINGGEWKGAITLNNFDLLRDFAEARFPTSFDGPKHQHMLDDEAGTFPDMMTDSDRLDKLQNLSRKTGKGWLLRISRSDRGMRLHETSLDGASPDVRKAIDAYTPPKTGLRFDNVPSKK